MTGLQGPFGALNLFLLRLGGPFLVLAGGYDRSVKCTLFYWQPLLSGFSQTFPGPSRCGPLPV